MQFHSKCQKENITQLSIAKTNIIFHVNLSMRVVSTNNAFKFNSFRIPKKHKTMYDFLHWGSLAHQLSADLQGILSILLATPSLYQRICVMNN